MSMDNVNAGISVSQLNNAIRLSLSREVSFRNVVVFGEVSSFKYTGPHAYFTLKDAEAAISCCCFNGRKTYNPTKEGESVLCVGSVDFYARTGRLSLIVNTIQPVGTGKVHQMLEERKRRLEAEGLFAPEHKKPIPPYCRKVCVVTSKTGAVIRDIVRTVRLVNDVLDIDVYDVRVQGEGAAVDMCRALTLVDTLGYDCVILARGGGSFEDLMPFNDEQLVRVIYAMRTPIISAVGHETDFSLSDFAADMRSATPTAAAQQVAFNVRDTKLAIVQAMQNAYARLVAMQDNRAVRLSHAASALSDKSMLRLTRAAHTVETCMERLSAKTDKMLQAKEQQLAAAMQALSAANPVRLLANGYCRMLKEGRNADYDSVSVGDEVEVVADKGVMKMQVKQKTDMVLVPKE